MAKACLNKLSANIVQSCTIVQNGIKNVYLMYPEDVTFTSGDGYVGTAAFVAGSKSYLIEGYKQNIQLTTSARVMDASMRLDYSLTFKIPRAASTALRAFTTGRFYAMVEYLSGSSVIVGFTCPLECSAIDGDSNANGGMLTITLTAPEGSAGNYPMDVATAAKDTITSKSV